MRGAEKILLVAHAYADARTFSQLDMENKPMATIRVNDATWQKLSHLAHRQGRSTNNLANWYLSQAANAAYHQVGVDQQRAQQRAIVSGGSDASG
jgi:predicted transcriptional regulator